MAHTSGILGGIDPESKLYREYKDYLLKGSNGRFLPNPIDMKAFKFYFDLYMKMQSWSIDFTKVDNQYDIVKYTENIVPINEAARNLLYSLPCASNGRLAAILNCMSMVPECFYHWIGSNVSRVSMDYIPNHKESTKLHVACCNYNALWYSILTTPDYDIFQSYDHYAKIHSLLRAISGGPVYLTDDPKKTNLELVKKLVFKDGRIPRPNQPALPTRDSLFREPIQRT